MSPTQTGSALVALLCHIHHRALGGLLEILGPTLEDKEGDLEFLSKFDETAMALAKEEANVYQKVLDSNPYR